MVKRKNSLKKALEDSPLYQLVSINGIMLVVPKDNDAPVEFWDAKRGIIYFIKVMNGIVDIQIKPLSRNNAIVYNAIEKYNGFLESDDLQAVKRAMSFEETNDPVNHPSHYTSGKIEVADFIADMDANFFVGNAVKYICRAGKKDPNKTDEDLHKAIWYLNKELKTREARRYNEVLPITRARSIQLEDFIKDQKLDLYLGKALACLHRCEEVSFSLAKGKLEDAIIYIETYIHFLKSE